MHQLATQRDRAEKAEAEIAKYLAENNALHQELFEPDSPEGQIYQAAVTRQRDRAEKAEAEIKQLTSAARRGGRPTVNVVTEQLRAERAERERDEMIKALGFANENWRRDVERWRGEARGLRHERDEARVEAVRLKTILAAVK